MKQPQFYFCQFGEDIIISQLLGSTKGEYIVIGSGNPVEGSVTKALYNRGWRGLHVVNNSSAKALIEFDRPRDIVIAKTTSTIDELAKEHELNDVLFVALHNEGLAELKNNKLKPAVVYLQHSQGADALLKGYEKVYSRGDTAVFSLKKPELAKSTSDLVYFGDFQKGELEREQRAVLQRSLRDEKHARKVLEQSVPLLPFAKLLFKSIDGKINSFMEKKQQHEPIFDATAKIQPVPPNLGGLKELHESYANSVQLRLAGPSKIAHPFIAVFWFLYRAARKAGKILFKLVRKQKTHAKEQAS